MSKPVTFTIEGGGNGNVKLTPAARRAKAILDASELGQMWSSSALADMVGITTGTAQRGYFARYLPGYYVEDGYVGPDGRNRHGHLWGSPATIKAYNEQAKANDDS